MLDLQIITRRWSEFCIVAASGPSLDRATAERCRGFNVIAVNDAWRLLPFAAALYACDAAWWNHHQGCAAFAGEKWSSHGSVRHDNKAEAAARWGLKLIKGSDENGFSRDPSRIHYGHNSGFQAVNLAALFLGLRGRIALVGFDMRKVDGRRHFFGEHPPQLRATGPGYERWPKIFARAAAALPAELEIVNCTPGSALGCFKRMDLRDALPAAA